MVMFFFFQAEDGIRDGRVTGVQTCALPIFVRHRLGGRQHLAHLHEDADEVGRWPAEPVGEVLHGHPTGHAHHAVDRDVRPRLEARSVHRLEFLAPPGSTPAPLGTRTAEAGEAPATTAAGTAAAATGAATAASTEPGPAAA